MGGDRPRLGPGHFCGTLRRRAEIAGMVLTDYVYAPDLELARHGHELPYASVVLGGQYAETLGRRTRTCAPMTVTVHPSGEEHGDRFHATGARIFSIEFRHDWIGRDRGPHALFDEPTCTRGGAPAALAVRIYEEFRRMDEVSALVVEGLSLELVAEAWRSRSPRAPAAPPWLRRARDLVREGFAEPLTLSAVARDVGVHPVHLAREFRRHYRTSLGEYVRECRVAYARRRLATSDTPLAEVASEAGFSQQSHFSRVFKRATGMTPGQYRGARASER
jgi:AraC family transcriptional regulator